MAPYTSSQNGWWDDTATWGGAGPPGDGDDATIGHIVAIRGNVTVGPDTGAANSAIAISAGGKLKWGDPDDELGGGATPVSASWTLTLKGAVSIAANGEWEIGTSTNPIPEAYTATVDIGATYEHKISVEGTLTIHGYSAYHMTSSDSQRAQLAANSASGTNQITLDKSPGWQNGDVVWIATGGDPTQTPTDNEKATVNTCVGNTVTLTGNLSNNHFGGSGYGDMVIHASRNVIFTGQGSTQGFAIHKNTAAPGATTIFDINWCRFVYGGIDASTTGSTININWVTNADRWDLGQITLRNLIFEDYGDSSAFAIRFYYAPHEPDPNFDRMNELHFWGYDAGNIYTDSQRGILRFGHVSAIDSISHGINGNGCEGVWCKGFWFTQTVPRGTSVYGIYGGGACNIKLENFKIHNAWAGIYVQSNDPYVSPSDVLLSDGEVYHILDNTSLSNGIVAPSTTYSGKLRVHNVGFYDIDGYGILPTYEMDLDLLDSTFDDCRRAIVLTSANARNCLVRVSGCDFGIQTRNIHSNIWFDMQNSSQNANGRFIFENCRFKEPTTAPATSYDWYPADLRFAVDGTNIRDWMHLCKITKNLTFEFINCEIQDSTGADQWATNYPNTNVLGIIAGRSEIHKTNQTSESSGYIDGSFQRKLLPFMGLDRVHMTKQRPILIPVTTGQSVVAKLSFKKNIAQDAEKRPMLHIFGCGVYDEAVMSDVIDTWEELSVNGVVDVGGVLELWVSCWGVQDFQTSAPTRTPTNDYNYAYPIDPGGTSGETGEKNLTLYCDGLDITIT
jgi:hypothetical protein